jgi:hypothetical protein
LWERKLYITIPLVALCLGHWGLLYRGMFIVHANWDPHSGACLVSSTDPSLLKVIFFFSKHPQLPVAKSVLRHAPRLSYDF